MFRFELDQRVIFGPTQEKAIVVARQEHRDGSRKYLVQRSIDGKAVEVFANESALEEIPAPAPAA